MTVPAVYEHNTDRPGWFGRRACTPDQMHLFFPALGEDVRPAKAICAGCPVRAECLNYALDNGIHNGIWGGTSELQRRGLRRGDPINIGRPVRPMTHGTPSGYEIHRRRQEPPCQPCAEARRVYGAARKAEAKAKAHALRLNPPQRTGVWEFTA